MSNACFRGQEWTQTFRYLTNLLFNSCVFWFWGSWNQFNSSRSWHQATLLRSSVSTLDYCPSAVFTVDRRQINKRAEQRFTASDEVWRANEQTARVKKICLQLESERFGLTGSASIHRFLQAFSLHTESETLKTGQKQKCLTSITGSTLFSTVETRMWYKNWILDSKMAPLTWMRAWTRQSFEVCSRSSCFCRWTNWCWYRSSGWKHVNLHFLLQIF